MDPYEALMSMQDIPEEQQRMLANQIRGGAATGAQLSTSTIEPVQNQGRLMQTQANSQAQNIGLMNSRKKLLEDREKDRQARVFTAALKQSGEDGSPFNNITSTERTKAVEKAQLDSKEVELLDAWNPDMQTQFLGNIVGWAADRGMPLTDAAERSVNYWKQYAQWENRVRNKLFGSALTGYELTAWKKATANASMSPEIVRKFMGIQRAAIEKRQAEEAATMLDFKWPESTLKRMFKALPKSAWEDLDAHAEKKSSVLKAFASEGGSKGDDLSRSSNEDLIRQYMEQ